MKVLGDTNAMSKVQPALSEPIMFEPVKHASLCDAVLADLRRAIIDGQLPPGERLIEADLAAQFHVSRAIMRQALQQLGFEGLVEARPRRGTVVTRMSSSVARDVCTVRGVLEGWAARTRLPHARRDGDCARMRAISDEMGACLRRGDAYTVVTLDIEYHTLICRSDPNQRLFMQWSSLNSSHGALMTSRLAHYNYNPANRDGAACTTSAMCWPPGIPMRPSRRSGCTTWALAGTTTRERLER